MLLERKLVEMLENHIIHKGEISRSDFINYVTKERFWPRVNYPLISDEMFRRKMEGKIIDCIKRELVEEENGKIKVNMQGRDFLKILGFFEEFLKRRKRSVIGVLGFIIGTIVTLLISYFQLGLRN